VWSNPKKDTLTLQLSKNNGAWATVPMGAAIVADSGLNTFSWMPPDTASSNCQLRLVNRTDTLLNLVSGRFTLAQ
jgi:hypothetical protein